MAKSRIIKELVNDEIGISKALYRLMLIADDIEDGDLFEWAEKEISGYKKEDLIPDYRRLSSGIIKYSGLNVSLTITNAPLPDNWIPEEIRDSIRNSIMYDGIEEIERMIDSERTLMVDLTGLAPYVYKLSSGMQCTSIWLEVDSKSVTNILSIIKTRLIKVLLKLEKEFGLLDELDINLEQISGIDLESLYKELRLIIYDNSIRIGEGNKISHSNFTVGSED